MCKKIVLAGGSGFLGNQLAQHLSNENYTVYTLTRKPQLKNDVFWDGKTLGEWKECINKAFAVINLAGKSVDCRYTKQNKKDIQCM